MTYRILFKKEAAKEMKRLPVKITVRISAAIDNLSENPRPMGCEKLEGKKGSFLRIRIGDYRVLYSIEDEIQIIDIHKVGHRKDVYR